MVPGSDDTSVSLTVDDAAKNFAGLLSGMEDTQDPDEEQEAPESDEDEETPTEEDGESEQATSEEESDDTDDENAEEKPQPRTIKLKFGDDEEEVTEEDLPKYVLRQKDYTQKTQAHAENVKKFEAEVAAPLREERKRLAEQLTQLEDSLKALTPDEPDWDQIREDDPVGWADHKLAWDKHKARLEKIAAEKSAAVEKVYADMQKAHADLLETEKTKLLDVFPNWIDAEVAKKENADIRAFAKSQGFSDEEINGVTNHRLVKLLHNAMMYERTQQAKEKVKAKEKLEKVKAAAPGASAKKKPMPEQTKRKLRLAKTGRVDDAAAVLFNMI